MNTSYPLPAPGITRFDHTSGSYARWTGNTPTTPDMRRLMDVVAQAVDSDLFYNTDVYSFVVPHFAFMAGDVEQAPGKADDGGLISSEIYYARRRVEQERADAKERETFARLALQPGQKLGSLDLRGQRLRRVRNAVVESAELGAVKMRASSGGRFFTVTMTATGLAAALVVAPRESSL